MSNDTRREERQMNESNALYNLMISGLQIPKSTALCACAASLRVEKENEKRATRA